MIWACFLKAFFRNVRKSTFLQSFVDGGVWTQNHIFSWKNQHFRDLFQACFENIIFFDLKKVNLRVRMISFCVFQKIKKAWFGLTRCEKNTKVSAKHTICHFFQCSRFNFSALTTDFWHVQTHLSAGFSFLWQNTETLEYLRSNQEKVQKKHGFKTRLNLQHLLPVIPRVAYNFPYNY